MLDKELKVLAEDWAEKVYMDICAAFSDPTLAVDSKEAKEYEVLKEWGWFDKCPIGDDNREEITRLHLAIVKYAKLKWEKDHPPKKKPSKWEVVTGATPRVRPGRK